MTTPDYTPETVTIPLTKGQTAIVDAIDADLAQLKWYAMVRTYTYYAARQKFIDGRYIHFRLHQEILPRILGRKLVKGEYVDHINGDGLDNRRSNLRLATKAQNQRNQRLRRDNKSGFKGVCWDNRAKKWRALIRFNGKQKTLGYFDTPEEAYEAYCAAAIELHGEFARLE
jgi:hypothetical protein